MRYRRQFIIVAGFSTLLLALSSCVDDSYDLSKDISLDMKVGESFTDTNWQYCPHKAQ